MRRDLILRIVAQLLIPFILLFGFYVQFHADFADDLARSREIEDALVNANSDLLKEDKVFLEEKRRIRTVADFIRDGHSVEEAERRAKEVRS